MAAFIAPQIKPVICGYRSIRWYHNHVLTLHNDYSRVDYNKVINVNAGGSSRINNTNYDHVTDIYNMTMVMVIHNVLRMMVMKPC